MDSTTRERIAVALREEQATASQLSTALGISAPTVYTELQHVARSVDGDDTDERFLVAPPECLDCGFSAFDDPVNYPSRCPACRSERIDEAVFKIEAVG
ncbi:transcriptional regulator [Haloferacaceae archaeon DSL9]